MARIIVRIELTPAAKERLTGLAESYGMTQISATSRLVEWFAQQDAGVQGAILGQYPKELERDIATLLLERAAGKKPARSVG